MSSKISLSKSQFSLLFFFYDRATHKEGNVNLMALRSSMDQKNIEFYKLNIAHLLCYMAGIYVNVIDHYYQPTQLSKNRILEQGINDEQIFKKVEYHTSLLLPLEDVKIASNRNLQKQNSQKYGFTKIKSLQNRLNAIRRVKTEFDEFDNESQQFEFKNQRYVELANQLYNKRKDQLLNGYDLLNSNNFFIELINDPFFKDIKLKSQHDQAQIKETKKVIKSNLDQNKFKKTSFFNYTKQQFTETSQLSEEQYGSEDEFEKQIQQGTIPISMTVFTFIFNIFQPNNVEQIENIIVDKYYQIPTYQTQSSQFSQINKMNETRQSHISQLEKKLNYRTHSNGFKKFNILNCKRKLQSTSSFNSLLRT